jgi:hypothetical protein
MRIDDVPEEYFEEYALFLKDLVDKRTKELMKHKQNVDMSEQWNHEDLRRWQFYEARKYIQEAQKNNPGGVLINTAVLLESDFEILKNFKEELKARLGDYSI